MKRHQIIKCKNKLDNSLIVNHGVPQGTVLGSILFILYIKRLLNINVEAEIICFADDTVILFHGKNIKNLYNKASKIFIIIKSWFNNNVFELK